MSLATTLQEEDVTDMGDRKKEECEVENCECGSNAAKVVERGFWQDKWQIGTKVE
jgi:hypothetical protein